MIINNISTTGKLANLHIDRKLATHSLRKKKQTNYGLRKKSRGISFLILSVIL